MPKARARASENRRPAARAELRLPGRRIKRDGRPACNLRARLAKFPLIGRNNSRRRHNHNLRLFSAPGGRNNAAPPIRLRAACLIRSPAWSLRARRLRSRRPSAGIKFNQFTRREIKRNQDANRLASRRGGPTASAQTKSRGAAEDARG